MPVQSFSMGSGVTASQIRIKNLIAAWMNVRWRVNPPPILSYKNARHQGELTFLINMWPYLRGKISKNLSCSYKRELNDPSQLSPSKHLCVWCVSLAYFLPSFLPSEKVSMVLRTRSSLFWKGPCWKRRQWVWVTRLKWKQLCIDREKIDTT